MHRIVCKQDMPDAIYKELMEEIGKAKLADRFTVENFAMSLKRVIQAHPDLYKIQFVE